MSDQEHYEPSLGDDRPPRSKVRLAFTTSLWLALLLIIIVIFSPVRDIALNRLFPPAITPTATVAAGDNLFYIQASPTGTVTIDGRPVTQLPAIGTGDSAFETYCLLCGSRRSRTCSIPSRLWAI